MSFLPHPDVPEYDEHGRRYEHFLQLGEIQAVWAHLIINQEDWMVFQNKTHTFNIIFDDKPTGDGKTCQIHVEEREID